MNGKLEEMLSFKVWDQALNFILEGAMDIFMREILNLYWNFTGTTATTKVTTVIDPSHKICACALTFWLAK